MPVRIERLPDVHFRITLHPLIWPDDTIEDERERALDMTQRLNDHYSEWIQARPSDWLCVKRRKPKERKARLRHLKQSRSPDAELDRVERDGASAG